MCRTSCTAVDMYVTYFAIYFMVWIDTQYRSMYYKIYPAVFIDRSYKILSQFHSFQCMQMKLEYLICRIPISWENHGYFSSFNSSSGQVEFI